MELYRDIHEMFKPPFLRYNIKPQMSLDISLWKTNTRKKGYPSLGQKYGQK